MGYREAPRRRILRSFVKCAPDYACGQVRLSTCATRAKLADHCSRELEIAWQWPASFSCQRALTSHPARLAEANFSGSALGTGFCSFAKISRMQCPESKCLQKICATNKKPGVKRRASPSTVSREGFTRSSTVAYPVFVSNLTSSLRERLPARRVFRACPVFRHQVSIRISPHSSSMMPTIFTVFPVNSTILVGIYIRQGIGAGPDLVVKSDLPYLLCLKYST